MTPLIQKLMPFCSRDKGRPAILNPFWQEGFLYATDGKIVVRTRKFDFEDTASMQRAESSAKAHSMFCGFVDEFQRHGKPVFSPLKNIPADTQPRCRCFACQGHGFEFKTDADDAFILENGKRATVECDDCERTGEIRTGRAVLMKIPCSESGSNPASFDVKYLHLISTLGEFECTVLHEFHPLWFKTTDGNFEGLLMPVRVAPDEAKA